MGKRRRRSNPDAWWKVEVGGMPMWGILGAFALIVVLAIATLVSMPEQSTADPNRTTRPVPSFAFGSTDDAEPTRIAVVGDSNTEVNSPNFSAAEIGDASWVRVLLSNGYQFAGGWADGGTTSTTQAESMPAVEGADTLLIMTGTNDLGQSVSFDQTTTNIDTMVAKSPAERIVLLAIPPRDAETDPSTTEFNASLQQLASARGWEYFDGMSELRAPGGGFIDGTSTDGVHLSAEAQARLGQAVRDFLAD